MGAALRLLAENGSEEAVGLNGGTAQRHERRRPGRPSPETAPPRAVAGIVQREQINRPSHDSIDFPSEQRVMNPGALRLGVAERLGNGRAR